MLRPVPYHFSDVTRLTAVLAFAVAASLPAQAATVVFEGQRFEDSVELGGQNLRLNGLGLRAVSVIRGYAAALYLSDPASSHADAATQPGPKRLEIRLLRDVPGRDLSQALIRGVARNSTEREQQQLAARLQQLTDRFEQAGARRRSDVITIDFLPGRGTVLRINGALQGDAIPGSDLYSAVLAVFVGAHPADERLRRGLLGLPPG